MPLGHVPVQTANSSPQPDERPSLSHTSPSRHRARVARITLVIPTPQSRRMCPRGVHVREYGLRHGREGQKEERAESRRRVTCLGDVRQAGLEAEEKANEPRGRAESVSSKRAWRVSRLSAGGAVRGSVTLPLDACASASSASRAAIRSTRAASVDAGGWLIWSA
ncbi:hypothetical protein MRB53_037149 [Persea americana]|nr:hypothetical protein MRB53_037149 [Persea americana]